jgi:hypothetical protein
MEGDRGEILYSFVHAVFIFVEGMVVWLRVEKNLIPGLFYGIYL